MHVHGKATKRPYMIAAVGEGKHAPELHERKSKQFFFSARICTIINHWKFAHQKEAIRNPPIHRSTATSPNKYTE